MTTTTANSFSSSAPATTERRGLNVALWVVQGLLAFAFLGAGLMKLTTPVEVLAESMAWIQGPLGGLVRFIGLAEVAGAVGLILPAALRIKPMLTPAAAGGLLLVMVLGALTHISLGEFAALPASLVLGSLAAFVAWGRTKAVPVSPR